MISPSKEISAQDFHPYLRDGVDVFIRNDEELHFIYLSSRKRVVVRAIPALIQSLTWLDGSSHLQTLHARFLQIKPDNIHGDAFLEFVEYLRSKCIVVDKNWLVNLQGNSFDRHEKQIHFFIDLLDSAESAAELQQKLCDTHVVIFGLGAVGSWVVRLLLQIGVRKFSLIDHAAFDPADIVRNAFYSVNAHEQNKATWIASRMQCEYSGVSTHAVPLALTIDTDLDHILNEKPDIIINAADEPYIGYTSIKLSRYCIKKRIPLLVAGGFDAHLASLGELIVPGVTPCADCYATFFKNALANWKPIPHPVEDRSLGFGGLCSLSIFAASAAVMKLLRYFMFGASSIDSGRGELLFEKYVLDTFDVNRDSECPYCSGIELI